jgi:hypothetical protein
LIYPKYLLAQVEDIEGPLKLGVLPNVKEFTNQIIVWIEESNTPAELTVTT